MKTSYITWLEIMVLLSWGRIVLCHYGLLCHVRMNHQEMLFL